MDSLIAESWSKVENAIGQRPQLTGDVFAMREQYKALADGANATRTISPNITVEDIKLSPNLTVRTYTPTARQAESNPRPVGLYFHGGGLCCGDLDSEDNFCRLLAERLPCIVISVGYRLAPEHKAPAQLDDALEAWNWAYNNASTLNGDRGRYFTVGQSAGGTLALAVARRLIVLGRKHEVKGIAAIVPFVVHPDGVPSRYMAQYRAFDELGDGPVNTKQAMTHFYKAIQAPPGDPDVYVLNAEADFHQFPPTYLAVCGIDPLRDDGLIIHDALKTAGVSVKLDYYQGLPHVFWAFGCPPPSGDFVADVMAGIRVFTHT
ncbi:lipase/esteras-like protein [Aspergillus udagawae]|uniref:Lipase/esteras-like protein n=1 Tax=Aspergillus udagawae TaxID=91492 RepID=A0ABQ1BE33_9EURO|nr:lipase/esteras-like protein [Aspergillus udagawae]GFG19632.1 lipase/esteras-like protein [Aspergillus udagawae]